MSRRPPTLARLCTLNRAQLSMLLQTWLLLPAAWLVMHRRTLPQILQWTHPRQHRTTSTQTLQTLGEAANMAARRSPFPVSCLSRSLVLMWLLGRRGVATDLRIGVNLQNGQLTAHAWVEHQGHPINDRPDIAASFAVFDGPIPAATRFTP